jgi:polyisoprenoid-binding protein YceI
MIHSSAPTLVAAAMFLAGSAFSATPAYVSDAARSQLEFSGLQAGASFKGVFKKFSVTAQFDPAQLDASRLDVQIDVNSLDSQDGDRDKTMRSAEFFDVAKNPSAHYVTRGISKTAKGYAAVGTLTLRGVSRDIPIEFQFTQAAGGATLTGDAALKRLDFGVGQGEWKSTEWVGNEVKIHFSISLKPAP